MNIRAYLSLLLFFISLIHQLSFATEINRHLDARCEKSRESNNESYPFAISDSDIKASIAQTGATLIAIIIA